MKGTTPTEGEKAWWSMLVDVVGCIACRLDGRRNHYCSIHHVDGRTKPDCHMMVLPLCGGHHQDNGGPLIAVHPWKRRFEARYGTQAELMEKCNDIVADYIRRHKISAGPTAAPTQEQQDGSKETSSEGQANARAGEIDTFDVETKGRQKGSAKAEEKARPEKSGRQGATLAGSAEPDGDGQHARSSSRTGDSREQHGQRRRVKL